MLVDKRVLLELKAGRALDHAHEAQLLNYLRATEIEVGMLFSFGLNLNSNGWPSITSANNEENIGV
jgi:GxxExxY protein